MTSAANRTSSKYGVSQGFKFDAFELKSKRDMVNFLLALCKNIHVDKIIKKSDADLLTFFEEVSERMPNNPFHNLMHITDVTQFCCTVLTSTKLNEWLSPIHLVSLFFGAVCHDMEHPGTSNVLAINDKTILAQKYGDSKCVLEDHHLTIAKMMIAKHNLFSNMKAAEREQALSLLETVIMSTDMGKHKSLTDAFAAQLDKIAADPKASSCSNAALRTGLLQIIMKSSDISNQARGVDTAWQWNLGVYKEFYAEGDVDRAKGRKVNPLHDRENNVIAKSTVGFIKFLVKPLFELLHRAVDTLEKSGEPVHASVLAEPLKNLDVNIASNVERSKDAVPGLPA